jgi:hypothetical protein
VKNLIAANRCVKGLTVVIRWVSSQPLEQPTLRFAKLVGCLGKGKCGAHASGESCILLPAGLNFVHAARPQPRLQIIQSALSPIEVILSYAGSIFRRTPSCAGFAKFLEGFEVSFALGHLILEPFALPPDLTNRSERTNRATT